MEKREIRREMKQRNLELDAAARAAASLRIFEQIEHLDVFNQARTIAVFASLADEPDTAAVLTRWSGTKCVLVPRVEGNVMHFHSYDPKLMACGAFGIAEPQAEVACAPSQIDLIVVPGTAFTAGGVRLGRGKGFYDKYLSQSGFRGYKTGVCYTHQIVAELPSEPHDVCMDCMVCG